MRSRLAVLLLASFLSVATIVCEILALLALTSSKELIVDWHWAQVDESSFRVISDDDRSSSRKLNSKTFDFNIYLGLRHAVIECDGDCSTENSLKYESCSNDEKELFKARDQDDDEDDDDIFDDDYQSDEEEICSTCLATGIVAAVMVGIALAISVLTSAISMWKLYSRGHTPKLRGHAKGWSLVAFFGLTIAIVTFNAGCASSWLDIYSAVISVGPGSVAVIAANVMHFLVFCTHNAVPADPEQQISCCTCSHQRANVRAIRESGHIGMRAMPAVASDAVVAMPVSSNLDVAQQSSVVMADAQYASPSTSSFVSGLFQPRAAPVTHDFAPQPSAPPVDHTSGPNTDFGS